jgi:hypothetical protein
MLLCTAPARQVCASFTRCSSTPRIASLRSSAFARLFFYAGAISPALVIRKTFVYGATIALLLFTYATVEAFVANLLVDVIGVSDRFANALLGTVLALAFHPIKNRMEHALRHFGPVAQREA